MVQMAWCGNNIARKIGTKEGFSQPSDSPAHIQEEVCPAPRSAEGVME